MGDAWRSELPRRVQAEFDDDLAGKLIDLRRDLHQHPELSSTEHRTARRLIEALEPLPLVQLERVAETGVVARIAGQDRAAPAVAIRGDIDALPITEATGLQFASECPGVMHACGHDVHAAWTVGAAALLARRPPAVDVVVLLQPAEETALGASAMIDAGALEGVGAIFGGHVDRRFALGEVVAQAGPLAAATDEFVVVVRGVGGHGARPHLCLDPVVAAAEMILSLQRVVSRRVDPGEPAVITVGTCHAGSAPNVIPERAELTGTLRATDSAVRQQLHDELALICERIASAHHVAAEVEIRDGTPPLVNTERESAWAAEAASGIVGSERVVPLGGVNMGGEDFAFYLERAPGCFLRIGAREPGGGAIGAHQPGFYPAEGALFVGAAVLAAAARRAATALGS